MNEKPSEGVIRRVPGKRTLFATTAVAAAVIAALHVGMPTQDANAAVAPVDKNIPPASVQIAPPSFAELIEAVQPAVVSIVSSRSINQGMTNSDQKFEWPEGTPFQKFFEEHFKQRMPEGMPTPRMQGMGSGFIVDPEGYIVTNHHVIDGAGEIVVILHDGTRHEATIKGRDPKTDLALLKIQAPEELPYVRFGKVTGWSTQFWCAFL